MKKVLLFLFVFAATGLAYGQIMWSDDFESYNEGDMIAASSPDWRTWQNSTAANADAPVTSDQAVSGKNSLHIFSATATAQGPMDVFLPFPAAYNTGMLHFEMMMYVQGNGAYFNFQGTPVEGTAWTLNSTFNSADGVVSTPEASSSTEFPVEKWFKVVVDVDLTLNQWSLSIDGNVVSQWRNTDNRVGGLNLYPLEGHDYYVDDVMYSHEPFVPGNLDLAMLGAKLPPRMLGGKEYNVTASVKNLGVMPINSYDITWTDGVTSGTKSITGTNIAIFGEEEVVFDESYMANSANSELTFTISNINGGSDDSGDNDSKTTSYGIVTPAPDKAVFVEEGTGTWCPWCTRGTVGMEYMAAEYKKYFVGVAVHNGDPMTVAEHDLGVRTFPGFTGFPGGVIDRTIEADPSALNLENQLFNFITETPVATLSSDVEFFDDGTFRTVTATVNATFKEDVSGDYRLLAVVSEDFVTGTGNGYNQQNAYAGGANGPMGGFENLPATIPASDMIYNHVSRAILGGFTGQEGSLPGTMSAGETYSYTFTYVVPEDQDPTQMAIAAVLLEPNGTANNAKFTYYSEWSTVSNVTNVETHEAFVGISPNPTNDVTFIKLNLENSEDVSVEVYNNVGQMILNRNYGQLAGKQSIPFNVGNLAKGIYHTKVNIGNQFVTRSIVVQ